MGCQRLEGRSHTAAVFVERLAGTWFNWGSSEVDQKRTFRQRPHARLSVLDGKNVENGMPLSSFEKYHAISSREECLQVLI